MKFTFPFFLQQESMDCGATCLRMISKYYGKSYSIATLRQRSYITREGASMLGLSDAAESIGFRTMGVKVGWEQLEKNASLPCVVHWKQNHFVVLYEIKKDVVSVADPAFGLAKLKKEAMLKLFDEKFVF